MAMKLVALVALSVALSGCLAVVDGRGNKVTTPENIKYVEWKSPAHKVACRYQDAMEKPDFSKVKTIEKDITGYGVHDPQRVAQNAINLALNFGISGDPSYDLELKAFLLRLAKFDAWTRLNFDDRKRFGNSSPAFTSAHFLYPVTNAILYLREQNLLAHEDLSQLKDWGTKIAINSGGTADGSGAKLLDSQATAAAAMLGWGVAMRDDDLVEKGHEKLLRVISQMRSDGIFFESIAANHQVIQPLVLAAAYAQFANFDVLNYAPKDGKKVLDAVFLHAKKMAENKHIPTLDCCGFNKDIYFRQPPYPEAHSRHTAFIPIFMHLYEKRPDFSITNIGDFMIIDNDLFSPRRSYRGPSAGGYSACFWGPARSLR